MPDNIEYDLHVWIEEETKYLTRLVTLSVDGRCICRAVPVDQAVECFRELLEEED